MNTDVQTPSSRGFAGATTVNVVLDKLDDFEIVSLPDNPSRTISWCTAPPSSGKQFSTYDDRVTLYVVGLTDVDVLFMQHPHAMGLIVLQQDEPFSVDAPPFAPDLARKLVIVRSKIPGDRAKLQAIAMSAIYLRIFTTRKWADDLARIVARKGTVQEIIDASEFIFDNFIDVNDSTYSLVACTKNIEPVDPLSTELVRLGYHDIDTIKTADSIGAIEEWRDQKEVHVFGPDSIAPYQYVTSVLRSGNSYAGHVVMVCSNHDVTPGTLDLFKILSSACQQVVSSALFNESPTALFLRKVIDDARLTQAYLDEQSALLNLETRGWFSLEMIDYRVGEYVEQPSWIASMLQKAYPDRFVFSYEDSLLVLSFYKDKHVSRRKEDFDKLNAFCREMKCMGYTSDAFERLRDLRFALAQARIARTYKSCIDIELRPLDNIDSRRVIHFSDAFAYYCLDARDQDSDLWSFCMSHTILDDIAAAEPGHSTSDIKLLYYYLFNERKTTPTAQQLHMHRNNVLYRINSIEKKFGINLEQFSVRERLISYYRYKILTSNKFRQLLV